MADRFAKYEAKHELVSKLVQRLIADIKDDLYTTTSRLIVIRLNESLYPEMRLLSAFDPSDNTLADAFREFSDVVFTTKLLDSSVISMNKAIRRSVQEEKIRHEFVADLATQLFAYYNHIDVWNKRAGNHDKFIYIGYFPNTLMRECFIKISTKPKKDMPDEKRKQASNG